MEKNKNTLKVVYKHLKEMRAGERPAVTKVFLNGVEVNNVSDLNVHWDNDVYAEVNMRFYVPVGNVQAAEEV